MRMLSGSRILLAAVLLCVPITSFGEVLKIVVNDTIHPITDEYIGRALAEAERNKDQALLIELNTPGGLLDSTRNIIEKILASPVPVIIYVTPSGSRAASAGFFILESADVAAMAPGTNTGAAHPVTLGGGKVDDVMKEKMENDAAALMRSVVSKRGRNVEVAESTVRQSKSFTDQEALSQKLIDYVATSDQNLLQQMQGKTVKRFDGKTITLNLEGETIRPFDMTLKQRILAFIMDPNIAFILLAIGALGALCGVQPSRRGGAGDGGHRVHPAGGFRAQSFAGTFCGGGADPGFVCPVRTGSEICHPWRSGDRRDGHHGSGRAAAGGRPHSGNASASADRAGGEHSAGRDHGVPHEHCSEGASQQGGDWSAGAGGRNRHRTDCALASRKDLCSRRTLGCHVRERRARRADGRGRGVDGLQLRVEPSAAVERTPAASMV